MKATAKDLRIHSKGLLDAVSKGENVVITFRGKPCARLVPYEKPISRLMWIARMICSGYGQIVPILNL